MASCKREQYKIKPIVYVLSVVEGIKCKSNKAIND